MEVDKPEAEQSASGSTVTATVAEKKALFQDQAMESEENLLAGPVEEGDGQVNEEDVDQLLADEEAMEATEDNNGEALKANKAGDNNTAETNTANEVNNTKKDEKNSTNSPGDSMSICLSVAEAAAKAELSVSKNRVDELKKAFLEPRQAVPQRAGSTPGGSKKGRLVFSCSASGLDINEIRERARLAAIQAEDEIELGEDAFTEQVDIGAFMDQMKANLNIDPGDDANAKKRARELSGDSKGLDHMQVFLESRKAEELREPTRLICYMEKPKDFFDLTSGFTYDVAERASKNELQGSYRDYWFERRVEWNKAAKVGIIKCEDSSNIELIAGALWEYAKKKDIDCRIIRLSELIEDWTVCLLLLNDSPMVKMGTDKAVISRYLQLNLAENGIPANTWHLVAAMQPFTGKVKIYKTVNGKRVDTGERKDGKVGNTLAVIHLKTHLLKKIGEEGLAFQHGRVPVKVSGHEKILLHDYEAPEQDNANLVPLGERRSDGEKNLDQLAKGSSKAPSRGGRGGGRGGRGRGGNPVPGRTTGPKPKRQKQQEQTKEVMVISPSHKLSEKSRTEIEADLRKNGSAGSTLLPMDFSRCKPDGQCCPRIPGLRAGLPAEGGPGDQSLDQVLPATG